MAIERRKPKSSDEDVDDMLDTLREQRRPGRHGGTHCAGAGDQVLLDYVAETEEGRVPPAGNGSALRSSWASPASKNWKKAIVCDPGRRGKEHRADVSGRLPRMPTWRVRKPRWISRSFPFPREPCPNWTKNSSRVSAFEDGDLECVQNRNPQQPGT